MNLIYDEINYMGLLSILELIMVLLKKHSFVILSDLNPLTGEVLESTNIKVNSRPISNFKVGCVFRMAVWSFKICIQRKTIFIELLTRFLFTGEKGKMLPDSGMSRVSIKSNVISVLRQS